MGSLAGLEKAGGELRGIVALGDAGDAVPGVWSAAVEADGAAAALEVVAGRAGHGSGVRETVAYQSGMVVGGKGK